jgi:hypothetical protein
VAEGAVEAPPRRKDDGALAGLVAMVQEVAGHGSNTDPQQASGHRGSTLIPTDFLPVAGIRGTVLRGADRLGFTAADQGVAMEPVSMIATALVAGAAAAAKDTATEMVKDAYSALKSGLRRLFGDDADAERTLEEYTDAAQAGSDPPPEDALRDVLTEAGAADAPEVVEAAERLLREVDPDGAAAGKYTVTVAGNVQGQVVGDRANVTMNFGTTPPA